MKTQLTSVDVWFLADELNKSLGDARIDKAYQLGSKELKIRAYATGKGALELVIAAGYVTLTNYPRKAPEEPTPFAMQLRKNFKSAYLREVKQHDFDRIIEFHIESQEKKFILIAELFSKGNVILCDENRKILGLLEWQTWKDRTLRVGQKYEYPPQTPSPLAIEKTTFAELLNKTNKKTAAAIATETGIGGLYAEEICLQAGTKKEKPGKELGPEETGKLSDAYLNLIEKIKLREKKPQAILENNETIDVIPFDLGIYADKEKKYYDSFNDALDEYYSKQEHEQTEKKTSDKYDKEKNKLLEIKQSQLKHLEEFEKESVESKEIGDLIYQNYSGIEEIKKTIEAERKKGAGWDELKKKYSGKEIGGLIIEDVGRDGTLTVILKKEC